PMDLIPSFCARKHGREKVEYPDPRVEPVLKETYGIMVYQEQIMKIAQIDRLGQRTDIAYDANGRIERVDDPSGRTTNHSYNLAGELENRAFADGTSITYNYDAMGRRTSMTDPTGSTTYAYDANGRPTQVAAPNGTLSYAYDLAGRRTGLTYPDGTTITYSYDAAGRLIGLNDPNNGDVAYALDGDGRLIGTDLPNDETRTFDYVNGQLVRHEDHGRVTDLTYDESGRIATLAGAQNHSYTYDQAGQLTQAVQDEGTYSYTYGPRGEITTISDPDRTRSFSHNANVEITTITDGQAGTGSVSYDEAGRMTRHQDPDGTVTTYTYDARGLLVEETITGNGEITDVPRQEPDPNAVCNNPADDCDALSQSGGLYRVRNGDPAQGESANRIYIERNVAAAATLGISDADPNGDGWAVVGRSNGTGDDGTVVNDWITDSAPYAAIRHHKKGCLTLTPADLGPVNVGSVRTLTGIVDTANCRPEPPSADVDNDGTPDDRQALYEIEDTGSRLYLYRNTTAAEAQLGVSDWDPDIDGLALYARTNGSGEYGALQEISNDPTAPRVSVIHGNKGCKILEPNRTDTVAKGQTRRLIVTEVPGGDTCPPLGVATSTLSISRAHNGDGDLVGRNYDDGGTAATDELLWDPAGGMTELLQLSTDGA
ncbi:MAG: hypothetical protein AAFY28_21515, partial [Actinomycetota bacterium]